MHRRLSISALVLALVLNAHVFAQQDATPAQSTTVPTVTAAATAERVRFAAPEAVAQLRLEVYDEAGQKVFDTEQRGGNILDWHLQDGSGARLNGAYLCVVTVKDLSGRLRQKLGRVTVGPEHATVQSTVSAELTARQVQAVGPVEAEPSLTVLAADAPAEALQSATIVAHDGRNGQVSRTRGDLTFRVGDFFRGQDREQMRLTEAGDLGLGIKKPQAKLDVAGDIHSSGLIRATNGIEFADGTVQTTGLSGHKDKDGNIVPSAAGSGTQDKLAKWIDNAGTLGDSVVTEFGGRIGIGTSVPTFKLDLVDNNASAGGFQLTNHTGGSLAQIQNRLVNDAGALAYYGLTSSAYTQAPILANRAFFGSNKVDTVIWTQTPNDIIFATNGLTTNTERMRINAAGNIGIGTAVPFSKLHVVGSSSASSPFFGLNIAQTLTFLSQPGSVPFVVHTSDQRGFLTVNRTDMLIDSEGNVGLGTGVPKNRLDVTGSAAFGSYAGTSIAPANALIVGGSVGIGTGTPTQLLHVNSTSGNAATLVQAPSGAFAQNQLRSGVTNPWILGTQDNYVNNALMFRNGATDLLSLQPNGNLSQPPSSNGLVKAALLVNRNGSINLCYNSQITGAGAVTPLCGFDVVHEIDTGIYDITFPFQVNSRFFSATTAYDSVDFPFLNGDPNLIGVRPTSPQTIRVQTADPLSPENGGNFRVDIPFYLIVY